MAYRVLVVEDETDLLDAVAYTLKKEGMKPIRCTNGEEALALVRDERPDLVLLDEPSNHMDLATLAMLERYLAEEIPCAFLLVSHDRALLDAVTNRTIIPAGAPQERRTIAAETCEAQYTPGRQNYLSAVQTPIAAGRSDPDASKAPLDAFRAEINASYNAVVQRCKTHMHCLEVQRYDEAKCYMAASDRKDAERRFADLAEDLRRIEKKSRSTSGRKGKSKPAVIVNNKNTMTQNNDQRQENDAQTGDRIEDQDVLAVCGNVKGLLTSKCRRPCANC